LAAPDAASDARFDVAIQRLLIEQGLVSSGIVEAVRGDAGRRGQVPDRGRFISLLSKAQNARILYDAFVKFPWPRHPLTCPSLSRHLAILAGRAHSRTNILQRKVRMASDALRPFIPYDVGVGEDRPDGIATAA